MFVDAHCNKIRYYNSPGNMYFIARYLACSMTTTKYCYFQDDDWMIKHLRSMYSNFLRFPNLIHSDTNADVYSSTNWKWCFFNDGKVFKFSIYIYLFIYLFISEKKY